MIWSPGRYTQIAQCNLGLMYESSRGVKHDTVVAAKWFRLAEAGYTIAQYNLGVMYEDGQGADNDDADNVKAVKWYLLTVEVGYASAQNNLGRRAGDGM